MKKKAPKAVRIRKAAAEKTQVEKVEAALLAAVILRPHGYWTPKEAEFVRIEEKFVMNADTFEFIEHIKTVDRTKLDRLLEILNALNIDKNRMNFFIEITQNAVIDFHVAKKQNRSETNAKRQYSIAKLETLANAAREFSQAWGDLGHDLQLSLICHMEGRFPTAKIKANGRTIMAAVERTKRIKAVATDDAWSLIAGVTEIIEALRDDRSHDAAEYACAVAIGRGWMDCTGAAPTVTRNDDVREQRTPFQRFMSEALSPLAVGDSVIRLAIQSLKIGDKSD